MTLRGERFLVLLVALLVFMMVRPFCLGSAIGSMVMDTLLILVFLSCINAISESKGVLYFMSTLFVIHFVLKLLRYVISSLSMNEVFLTAMSSIAIVFQVMAVVLVLAHVLKGGRVTRDRIAAAICVYLLLGAVWAQAYTIMEVLHPGSFVLNNALIGAESGIRYRAFDAFYFSFVTLTTLGYGDITPVHHVARAFATLEAVVGPLYLAILIARLVGLHIAQKDAMMKVEPKE
jgi:hypothetical protein